MGAAMQQNWKVVENAPADAAKKLWELKEIVTCAVAQEWTTIKKAPKPLQADREVIMLGLQQDWHVLDMIPPESAKRSWDDPAVVLVAMQQDLETLRRASSRVLNNRDVMMTAVTQNGLLLELAGDSVKANREVVLV